MSAIPNAIQQLEIASKKQDRSTKRARPEISGIDQLEAASRQQQIDMISQPQEPPDLPPEGQSFGEMGNFGDIPPMELGSLVNRRGISAPNAIVPGRKTGATPDIPEKAATRTALDALSDAARDPLKLVPFVGSVAEGTELYGLWDAAKRFEAGNATDEDNQLLEEFLANQKAREGSSVGATVVDLVAQLPAFIGEFVATGGIYSGAKAGTKKLLGKGIRKSIEKTLTARVATETAGIAVGAAARTAAMPHRIVTEMIRRTLPEIGEDEAGKLAVRFKNEGDNGEFIDAITSHFGEGLADTYIEMFSEQLGGVVKIPGMERLKTAIFQKWLKINPANTVSKFTKKLAKEGGWHGVAGEIFEEEIGKAMRAIPYGVDDEGRLKQLQAYQLTTGKELLTQAIAFSVPGAVSVGLQATAGESLPPEAEAPSEAPPPTETTPLVDQQAASQEAENLPEPQSVSRPLPEQDEAQEKAERTEALPTETKLRDQDSSPKSITTPTKEKTDAEKIHEDGKEVRKDQGSEDVRRRGQDTEGKEAARDVSQISEVQVGEVKEAKDTPAMRQYKAFKASHPGSLLLIKMGDFYEAFEGDAKTLSKVAGLTLTQRTEGIPMAGFPYHMLQSVTKKLIEAGHRVAVADPVAESSKTVPGTPFEEPKPQEVTTSKPITIQEIDAKTDFQTISKKDITTKDIGKAIKDETREQRQLSSLLKCMKGIK